MGYVTGTDSRQMMLGINICGGVHNLIDRYRRIAMPKIRKIAEF